MSQTPSQKPPLDCQTGPITKTYGGTSWLVYSCDDGGTVIFLSAPGSPAFPFYFALYPTEKGRRIEGEGTGDKKVTDAVVEELQRLSEADVAALIAQTKQVPKSN